MSGLFWGSPAEKPPTFVFRSVHTCDRRGHLTRPLSLAHGSARTRWAQRTGARPVPTSLMAAGRMSLGYLLRSGTAARVARWCGVYPPAVSSTPSQTRCTVGPLGAAMLGALVLACAQSSTRDRQHSPVTAQESPHQGAPRVAPRPSRSPLEAPPLDDAARVGWGVPCQDHQPLFHRAGEPPPLSAVELQGCTLLCATVLAVRDEGATQASPPTVWLRIDEVLAGQLAVAVVPAVWTPEPRFSMCSVGEAHWEQQWREIPMQGPAVGSRVLVAGALDRTGRWFLTRPALRRPFSPELREALRAKVAAEQASGP